MSNPNRTFFDLCFENRKQTAQAITLAGGNAELVMDDTWNDVLFVLATNNIAINAVYRGKQNKLTTLPKTTETGDVLEKVGS